MATSARPVALITGASSGIGEALARANKAAGKWVLQPPLTHERPGSSTAISRLLLEQTVAGITTLPVIGVPLTGTPLWCRYLLAWRPESVNAGRSGRVKHRRASYANQHRVPARPRSTARP